MLGLWFWRTWRYDESLGKFGLGLKTASSSQARKFSVITTNGEGSTNATWDLDEVVRGLWVLKEESEHEEELVDFIRQLQKTQMKERIQVQERCTLGKNWPCWRLRRPNRSSCQKSIQSDQKDLVISPDDIHEIYWHGGRFGSECVYLPKWRRVNLGIHFAGGMKDWRIATPCCWGV